MHLVTPLDLTFDPKNAWGYDSLVRNYPICNRIDALPTVHPHYVLSQQAVFSFFLYLLFRSQYTSAPLRRSKKRDNKKKFEKQNNKRSPVLQAHVYMPRKLSEKQDSSVRRTELHNK